MGRAASKPLEARTEKLLEIRTHLRPLRACVLCRVQLFATLWTAAHKAPLSMGLSRQEDWSGLLFPSPGDLPDPGLLHCQVGSLPLAPI